MHTLGISLSDAGITTCLYDGDDVAIVPLDRRTPSSSGYAYLGDRGLVFGEAALGFFKLSPNRTTDRFWDQLSLKTPAIPTRSKPISNAHLAYLHLKFIWDRVRGVQEDIQAVGLALSSTMLDHEPEQEEKLGILLGIISDLGIPLSALVPLGSAFLHYEAHEDLAGLPVFFHLDLHQYHTQLFRLSGESEVRSQLIGSIPNCGFHQVLDNLHAHLAQRFLNETAFDVSEDSEVEQAFFLKTRDLLFSQRLAGHRAIGINYGGQARSMQIAEDTLESMISDSTRRIAEMVSKAIDGDPMVNPGQPVTLVLSGRTATLPGLASRIARACSAPVTIHTMERGAAAAGSALVAQKFEPARDLQHTPVYGTWKRPAPVAANPQGNAANAEYLPPTHVLFESVAYPLEHSGLFEGPSTATRPRLPEKARQAFHLPWKGGDLQVTPATAFGILVNGREPATTLALKTGDRITVDSPETSMAMELIHCARDHS